MFKTPTMLCKVKIGLNVKHSLFQLLFGIVKYMILAFNGECVIFLHNIFVKIVKKFCFKKPLIHFAVSLFRRLVLVRGQLTQHSISKLQVNREV